MIELDSNNFEAEVTQAKGVVMVDFWGDTCENCLNLMPDIEKFSQKYGDKIKFAKLNIKGSRRLAMAQKVMGLPTVCFYENGEKKEQIGGEGLTAGQIEETIQKYYR